MAGGERRSSKSVCSCQLLGSDRRERGQGEDAHLPKVSEISQGPAAEENFQNYGAQMDDASEEPIWCAEIYCLAHFKR